MYHFIFPIQKSSWSVNENTFLPKLLKRWAQARVERPSNPEASYQFAWSTLTPTTGIYGSVGRDGKSVRLDGHFQETAEFAVWFQQQYPKQQLALADESANFWLKLQDKTVEQVLTALTSEDFEGDDPQIP